MRLLVCQYAGMTREDAVALRFGPAGPPEGAVLVVINPALPPPGVHYDWFTRKDTAEFEAAWEACRAVVAELPEVATVH